MSNNYEYKYSKYKNKYLSLKNEMKGGSGKILTQEELNEVIAFSKLVKEKKDNYKKLMRSGGYRELEAKIKSESERLINKGIPGIVLTDEIYWNPNFYKIDDKIKAENIKKYKENKKVLRELKQRSDSEDADYEFDRAHGSTRQPKAGFNDTSLYSALDLKKNLENWFYYHGIDGGEWYW